MRKLVYGLLTLLIVALVGCVTINVYFPAAAAQKAADQFIGNVLDGDAAPAQPAPKPDASTPPGNRPSAMLLDLLVPAAQAADTPNLRVQTATTEAIRQRMRTRFENSLKAMLDSGAIGFTNDGLVALHDASKVPLAQRAQLNTAIADENRDRDALYREIASANNHPEWEAQIRATFAKGWISHARAGWYYQDASGAWKRK
ncbi:YdbL family protein [Fulvimonas sp. R45]|uniref:YdbL family protein n=1 Tax=Fulvimonas sp. R45 TaxID=3045937 RepID=UPI00265FA929|nr:YdbL family protein [Fulvimonas sp. R45]MDO1528726.1 YdbL family protein [Fulvimonas sp. R45]